MAAIEVGAVLLSRQGRDKGNYFICIKVVSETQVLIADGEIHKLQKPKLKNIKHIKPCGEIAQSLKEKLSSGKKVFDSEVRKFLRPFNEKVKSEGQDV